ncbi:MAG: transposase, partial [Candidatus Omnitrophota bacterium]
MGVVHKLSQEVIDYIVQSKQDEASLSCRKIAALVDAKFNLHVSKSSVSTILKKENLSSTVGRRSKTEMGEAQFKIPNSKKEQMRKAMQTLKKQPGTQLPKEIKPKADLKARLSQLRNKAR